MMGILKQWKLYIDYINYKIFIRKKLKKVSNDNKELTNKLNKIKKELQEKKAIKLKKAFEISTINKKIKHDIILNYAKKTKKTLKDKIKDKFSLIDGYIFYINKGNTMKIYTIKNISNLIKLNNKESYFLKNKIGYYKGKPYFLVKYPYPISLNISKEIKDKQLQLFYDSESFYKYENVLIKKKLTGLNEQKSIIESIKDNWMIVLIILGIIIFFMTPEGSKILSELISGGG